MLLAKTNFICVIGRMESTKVAGWLAFGSNRVGVAMKII